VYGLVSAGRSALEYPAALKAAALNRFAPATQPLVVGSD
jgi:hypothetical protein